MSGTAAKLGLMMVDEIQTYQDTVRCWFGLWRHKFGRWQKVVTVAANGWEVGGVNNTEKSTATTE